MKPSTNELLRIASVFLIACVIYANSLGGTFVSDDGPLILNHPYTKQPSDLPRIFTVGHYGGDGGYRPLTTASFALNYWLRGASPRGFHFVNVILHALASVLVYLLCARIFRAKNAALIAALIFAVHPIHTEAVAWISGRAELLAAFFFLASWLLYLRATEAEPNRTGLFICSLGLFFAGLLSKENVLSLPLAMVAGDACVARWNGHNLSAIWRSRWKFYAAFAGIVAFYFVFRGTLYYHKTIHGAGGIPFSDNPVASAGRMARGLTALKVLGEYFLLLIWPRHLTADYSFNAVPIVRSLADPGLILALAIIFVLIAICFVSYRRRGKLCLPIALAFITIAPTANLFIPIGQLKAERLLYLPSVGFCLAAGLLAAAVFDRLAGRSLRVSAAALFALALLLLSYRTWKRNEEWRSEFTVWATAAHTAPQNFRAQMLSAALYLRAGSPEAAIVMNRRALAIDPSSEDAIVNLGISLAQAGRLPEAIQLYEHAVEEHPQHAPLRLNLGLAYAMRGDILSAAEKFREAIRLDPNGAPGYLNLGRALSLMSNKEEALENYRHAVELAPDYAEAWNALGAGALKLGRKEEAREAFMRAVALRPGYQEAISNLQNLDRSEP